MAALPLYTSKRAAERYRLESANVLMPISSLSKPSTNDSSGIGARMPRWLTDIVLALATECGAEGRECAANDGAVAGCEAEAAEGWFRALARCRQSR